MTPKPPSPRRVSATLAAAGFRAASQYRAEGFQTEWAPGIGAIVRVRFVTGDPALRRTALGRMAATLRWKGWQVAEYADEGPDRAYLTVTEA